MKSELIHLGTATFPEFSATRVMMMPFVLGDPHGSLPHFVGQYRDMVAKMLDVHPETRRRGVGYLTIDEATVLPGETHRRPGLHVDGHGGKGGKHATHGGGGGYGYSGLIVASTHEACNVWTGEFEGEPGDEGDCSHMASQCTPEAMVRLANGNVYWLNPTALHESTPLESECRRQFIRISMPSESYAHDGWTANPIGVKPTGVILPKRHFMNFRVAA